MGISGDDRVTGEIVLATLGGVQAPTLTTPDAIADRVSVRPYNQGGYIGSDVFFSDLSFAELQQLTTLTAAGSAQYQLALRRMGSTVNLEGLVNLTTLRADGADVQLRVNFPGNVTATNGTLVGEQGVQWQFPAGETSKLQASAHYDDPGTRNYRTWILTVVLLVLAAAALVTTMAWLAHARPSRFHRRSQ